VEEDAADSCGCVLPMNDVAQTCKARIPSGWMADLAAVMDSCEPGEGVNGTILPLSHRHDSADVVDASQSSIDGTPLNGSCGHSDPDLDDWFVPVQDVIASSSDVCSDEGPPLSIRVGSDAWRTESSYEIPRSVGGSECSFEIVHDHSAWPQSVCGSLPSCTSPSAQSSVDRESTSGACTHSRKWGYLGCRSPKPIPDVRRRAAAARQWADRARTGLLKTCRIVDMILPPCSQTVCLCNGNCRVSMVLRGESCVAAHPWMALPPPLKQRPAIGERRVAIVIDQVLADVKPFARLAEALLRQQLKLYVVFVNRPSAIHFEASSGSGAAVIFGTHFHEALDKCQPSIVLHAHHQRTEALRYESKHAVPSVMVGFRQAFVSRDMPARPSLRVRDGGQAGFQDAVVAGTILRQFICEWIETGAWRDQFLASSSTDVACTQ